MNKVIDIKSKRITEKSILENSGLSDLAELLNEINTFLCPITNKEIKFSEIDSGDIKVLLSLIIVLSEQRKDLSKKIKQIKQILIKIEEQ